MAELISLREYARRRGCAVSAVSKAASEGRITLINGKIDPEVADIQWAKNTRARGDSAAAGGATPPAQGQTTGNGKKPPTGADLGSGDVGPDYGLARARREQAEAERAELELARSLEQVIEAKPAASGTFTAFRALRDQVMVQPRKLATRLASLRDPLEIRVLLESELRQVFDQVATRAIPALLASMGPRSLAGLSMDPLAQPLVPEQTEGEGAGD